MKQCVVCKTRYQKGSGVTFHKFPSDKVRLELWLKNIKKPDWHPKKYDYLCSKHFSDDCLIKHYNSCTTLKKCSIPTMFCSSAENRSSTQESIVLPTPGTSEVTLSPSVPETIAVDVKRTIMDQNMSQHFLEQSATHKFRTEQLHIKDEPVTHNEDMPIHDTQHMDTRTQDVSEEYLKYKILNEELMIKDEPIGHVEYTECEPTINDSCTTLKKCSIPTMFCSSAKNRSSTQKSIVLPTPGTSEVTLTPSVPETIAVDVKRTIIMDQNDNSLSCQKCTNKQTSRSTSCDSQHSIASKNVRSLVEVCDIIKHDHRYENTPSSNKEALQRAKQSLKTSRAYVKVLSQKVKRLKNKVSSLRTIIRELKKKELSVMIVIGDEHHQ